MTPNALAVAPLATQAKTPMIIMNAASSIITTKSPYVARFSMTLPQVTEPIALWSAKNGIKKVFTIVSDYAPGIDAENAFLKSFSAQGGQVVGSVRVPLRNPDFAALLLRLFLGGVFITQGSLKILNFQWGTAWFVGVSASASKGGRTWSRYESGSRVSTSARSPSSAAIAG